MSKKTFPGYDTSLLPLTTGTPTWVEYVNAEDGSAQSEPVLDAFTDGWSGYTSVSNLHCGIVDCGVNSLAIWRYRHIGSENPQTFFALDEDGALLTGITPAWTVFKDAETGEDLLATAPAITAVTSYIWKFTPPSPDRYCIGKIDLGASAFPRYIDVNTDIPNTAPPVISNIDPDPSGPDITPSTVLKFDATDDADALRKVLILVQYSGFLAYEVIHDGDSFAPVFAGSTRTAIANGWHFELMRIGGWPGAPSFKVIAFDSVGNEN